MNYSDTILQLSNQIVDDMFGDIAVLNEEKTDSQKEEYKKSVLRFVNNYLTDKYVRTDEIGFSDIGEINEFVNSVDIYSNLIILKEKGLINSIDVDNEDRFFLTDKGKRIAQQMGDEEE